MMLLSRLLPQEYYDLVPLRLRKQWEKNLLKSMAFEVMSAFFIIPFVSLFVRIEQRTDVVKLYGKKKLTMWREYLPHWAWRWQTHDNAQDEYFFGLYADEKGDFGYGKDEAYFRNHWWFRYANRVLWGWRNNSYGYLYRSLGVPFEEKPQFVYEKGIEGDPNGWIKITVYKNHFHFEMEKPIGGGEYLDFNFGHKDHKSAPIIEGKGIKHAMYANNVIFNTKKYK